MRSGTLLTGGTRPRLFYRAGSGLDKETAMKRFIHRALFGHDWDGTWFQPNWDVPRNWEVTCSCGYTLRSMTSRKRMVPQGYHKRKAGIYIDGEYTTADEAEKLL